MIAKKVGEGIYEIPVGFLNVFLLEDAEGCTLVDTGTAKSEEKILKAMNELGKTAADVRSILVTHAHPDHIGSLAALKRLTGARVYVHRLDAQIARKGTGFRPLKPSPGLKNHLMVMMVKMMIKDVEPAEVDEEVNDGELLSIAGGLTVIHTPGHCLGQVGYLSPREGGILFAGDACANMRKPDWSIAYEDIDEGARSLEKLGRFQFDRACFGHGRALMSGASEAIRERWPAAGNVNVSSTDTHYQV